MTAIQETCEDIKRHIDRNRLLDTAVRLVEVASPTGQAGGAADRLAEILAADGFEVERPEAGHPAAPAVVVRYSSGRPGPTLQFNGHLDVVHLPVVAPRVDEGRLLGSGSCDMKGGVAAAVEALRAVRSAGVLRAGTLLFTAHDLHEAPWGFGEQLEQLIALGYVGDAVLIPEPLCDRLPVAGRGQACWKATIRRDGAPVHEVMRPLDQPSVIASGALLVDRLMQLDRDVGAQTHPIAGTASAFVGQIHAGEIFNQYPQECWLEGTRRWLPGTDARAVERDFRGLVAAAAQATRTSIDLHYQLVRDAYFLDTTHPFVDCFLTSYSAIQGVPLQPGSKPFVDDGNEFWAQAKVPAITHGALAGGQHTTSEWVAIEDLVRVAHLYALTAARYCQEE